MADHPMLFSAPMIRALLEGRKTQTRRVIKPYEPPLSIGQRGARAVKNLIQVVLGGAVREAGPVFNPHISVGDRIWVRESVAGEELADGSDGVRYFADGAFIGIDNTVEAADRWSTLHWYRCNDVSHELVGKKVPAIHMPKWASRLTLVVEGVKVERLQDISEADALAEGIAPHPSGLGYWVPGIEHPDPNFPWLSRTTPREMYAALWDTINGSGAWGENPWVVAYTFRPILGNIDQIGGGHV